ncbi:MAG: NADP-dependent oxidoreductase [Thermoleophilia bacterium]|nr:NADP-dependent oxidoreductase [Gaiellaceae bacterium]MDW8338128.1 NADP-dependent oxidoreductase [Thermoleophilia bacterium]
MEGRSREVRLRSRPRGRVRESDFELVEVEVPAPQDGEILVRNAYLSLDPYMRPRMSEGRSYLPPYELGETLTGGAVGCVVESRSPRFAPGDWVLHDRGFREWALCEETGVRAIDPAAAPVSTALGVLGMPGLTASHGLFEIGRPKEGEVVYVSAAAGAVGSAAGQMAKIAGCRVIGSAGSSEKVAWLRELGFDAAFDYRERPPGEALRALAPEGIDIYFDNVGGEHLEAAIGAMRAYGRIVACGAIALYEETKPPPGPRNLFLVVTKRLTMQGFIVSDHFSEFPAFLERAREWLREGRLRARETIVEGIENLPAAFVGLFAGESIGKLLVRVGPAPA